MSTVGQARSPIVLGALVFLATLALFLPPSGVRFLNWDDEERVVADSSIHGLDADHLFAMVTRFSVANYTPVERLSCALDWAFWGPDPWGFRFTNALLHSANAALWFLVSLRLLRLGGVAGRLPLLAAGVSALAFSLHPLRVESVAWISERRDVLSLFWSLLAVLLHLRRFGPIEGVAGARGVRPLGWGDLASMACFILALLSKASAVMLPVVLWLIDAFPLRRFGPGRWRNAARCLVEKAPWFVASWIVGCLALLGQQWQGALAPVEVYPAAQRALHACLSVATWCARWVAPVGLGPYYAPFAAIAVEVRVASWLALGWIVGVSAAVTWQSRRWPAAAVAWFSFLAMILPFSALVQAGGAGVADRYTYMAMLPVALLTGSLLLVPRGRLARMGLLLALAGVLAGWALETRRLIPVWNNSRTLWTRGVATAPGCDLPLANLASTLLDEGEIALARVFARDAIRAGPSLAEGHASLAMVCLRQGRREAAARELEAILRIRPGDAPAHAFLVSLLPLDREAPRVARHAFAALQCGGGAEAELNLAIVLGRTGHETLATKYLQRSVEGGSVRAFLALAAMYERKGDRREAVSVLRRGYARTGDRALLKEAWRLLRGWPAVPSVDGSVDHDRQLRP